jgi:hypothetical protein
VVDEEAFDPEAFYVLVEATAKERSALRQDLVRGLKEYYESLYGYDRYGGETIFLLEERMGQPYVFGFAVQRILHDRRITQRTKQAVAALTVDKIRYGSDFGLPFGIIDAVEFLASVDRLAVADLRYVLTATAGEYTPFRGMEKMAMVRFFRRMLSDEELPAEERAFWGHSLLARHQDEAGALELTRALVGALAIPGELRGELCLAWLYMRQPRLEVPAPVGHIDSRSTFVAEHMPFWVAHMPSWPSATMTRLGLASLPMFGGDPSELIQTYIMYRDGSMDAVHAAVADIIEEYHSSISEKTIKQVLEQGIGGPGSVPSRRRFYRLGTDLYGPEYLQRATHDTAGSVRQWASRLLQKNV